MMVRSVGKRALRTFLWMAFLHVIFITAERVKDASPSSVLQRQKREWQWNMMTAYEEKQPQNPPEIIGKVGPCILTETFRLEKFCFNVSPHVQDIDLKIHTFCFESIILCLYLF